MTPEDDRALAAAFARLRREEAEQTTPFDEVVRRGRAHPARAGFAIRPLWLAAAAALAMLLGVWLGREPRPSAVAPSLTEWRSPTDFLLATPGRDFLSTPAWGRSVLDLREVPLASPNPSSERRSPS